jgi:hypothetical protein
MESGVRGGSVRQAKGGVEDVVMREVAHHGAVDIALRNRCERKASSPYVVDAAACVSMLALDLMREARSALRVGEGRAKHIHEAVSDEGVDRRGEGLEEGRRARRAIKAGESLIQVT